MTADVDDRTDDEILGDSDRRWRLFADSIPDQLSSRARWTLFSAALLIEWGDTVWPENLVESTGFSDNLVRRHLAELIEAGAVTWDQGGVHVTLPGCEFGGSLLTGEESS